MNRAFKLGGILAGAVLIAFGVVAIVMGFNGRHTVASSLKQEQIVGTPDMTPRGIKAEAQQAGLTNVSFPTCSVANEAVMSGATARCFAQYMQIHALEATGGFVYSQMGEYAALPGTPKAQLATGGGTNDPKFAQLDAATRQPVSNGARNVWVTETALTTALNSSYMASQLGLFAIVVGFALVLAGLGFVILTIGGALRAPESDPAASRRSTPKVATPTPLPTT